MRDQITHSLVKALRAVPAFASFDDRTLIRVVGASANLFWRAGTPVFAKGTRSEALYIVLSGCIRIVDDEDAEEDVARLGPGQFFGELSLLLHTGHSKAAVALEDSELMVIPKASFQELLADYPELAAEFRRTVEQRLGTGSAEARLT